MLKSFVAKSCHALKIHKAIESWRILMFHRVTDYEQSLEEGMFVTPETFRRQLEFLTKNYRVVPLMDLLLSEDRKGTISLTFDDGWLDNYTNAWPILREFKCPATIFLPTSFIGTKEKFWTDLVEEKSIAPLKSLPRDERRLQIQRLVDKDPGKRVFMNWEEVKEMSQNGITFGSHSHNHEYQAELSEEDVVTDYQRSLSAFKAHAIEPVPCYCYPGGKFNSSSQKALSDCGVKVALTTEPFNRLEEAPMLFGRRSMHFGVAETEPDLTFHLWVRPLWPLN